jgi:hypothetical protein
LQFSFIFDSSLLERNLNKEKASKNFGTEIIVKIKMRERRNENLEIKAK